MADRSISDMDMDILFREARTHAHWLDRDVSDVQIRALFDLLKMGPTSANCSPARFIFVKSDEAKERLKPHLAEGNVEKVMNAPVCAIVAEDMEFYEQLPKLFPHTDARSWFAGNEAAIDRTAFQNTSLQAAYLIMAARSLGLDCGPMAGFDADGLKRTFFADQNVRINLLCNIGYGDAQALQPRSPRFKFDDICQII